MKHYYYGKQSLSLADIWAVIKVLRSPWLTQGPKVREFEQALCDYTGAKYCVVVANGAAALHLALLSLELPQGAEGITSPNTFVASANAILYAGGSVRFADIEESTANIDPEEIKKQITSKTKVLIPVHFAGQSCDMEKIQRIAKEHNLFIVEDAAHAIGSEYKDSKVGSCKYSDIAIFSFHPVKTITSGEGGAIMTNNKALYEKLLMLRTHGITKDPNKFTKNDGPWYYEQQLLGFNYRLTDIQCALGISQLKRLDSFVKRRREIVDFYKKTLEQDERFSFLEEKNYSKAAFHLCPILINFECVKTNKKDLFEKLQKNGLHLQVLYIPVHTQPYYQKLGFAWGDYPRAERYYQKTMALPLYPSLRDRDLKKIVTILKRIVT
jgi:UDP-4-amino-4,6-dideoxy-N-acetyl-beta-L-altrosamine transaminase